MLRFALGPEGEVVPDIRRKLPGRGVWTSLSADAVVRAVSKGAFARAFRDKVAATADLARDVDMLLERDALQSLSMANKAGLVVAGAFKVDAAIADGGIAVLIQASDGTADGLAKRGIECPRVNFPTLDSSNIAKVATSGFRPILAGS